jgi:hypothetical protein
MAAKLLPPPLRRQGVKKAACEPLARGLRNAIELCSMAGTGWGGCLQHHDNPWTLPPNLPLPSQGEGRDQKLAAQAAPTRRSPSILRTPS